MAPLREAPYVSARKPHCNFCVPYLACFFVFFLHLSQLFKRAHKHITYETLINIGTDFTRHSDSRFFYPDPTWPPEITLSQVNHGRTLLRQRRGLRGKRTGVRNRVRAWAHSTPTPSVLLANVQSVDHRLDDLRARIQFRRDFRDRNALSVTKTWFAEPFWTTPYSCLGFVLYCVDGTLAS